MQSHTVPKRLLRQFSYRDISTGSWRLWRYEKGRPPSPKASPKTATRIDGHFADPSDAQLEADVERRLADEIEDPVNRFVVELCDPSFVMTDTQRGQMTQYITLLFNRSMARRAATRHIMDVRNYALKQFLENKSQLETVAVQWNLDAHFQGVRLERLITSEDVARAARRLMAGGPSASEEQKSYARSIVHAMAEFDETLFRGEWKLLGATQEVPFILSDAPVVTWERLAPDDFSYGIGFHRPNVEVFLPVSPLTCLQILPRVERTRPTTEPLVSEINIAQAKFAYRACFASMGCSEIDELVQKHISSAKLGQNAFTVWHRKYDNTVYEILMNRGR